MIPHFELKKEMPTLQSLGLATAYFPDYHNNSLHPHTVDVMLYSCIIRGRGKHIIDGREYPESAPAITITHYKQNHTIIPDADGMDIMNLLLDPENHILPGLPSPYDKILPAILPADRKFGTPATRLQRIEFDDKIPEIIFALHRELTEMLPGYQVAAYDMLRIFLIMVCRQIEKSGILPLTITNDPIAIQMEKVRNYCNKHFADLLELDIIAEVAGMSKPHLCRCFKKYTGKTVFTYILEQRIQAAMQLLRTTDERLYTIAYSCGFRDLSNFNRKFKQFTDNTPGNYRKKAVKS